MLQLRLLLTAALATGAVAVPHKPLIPRSDAPVSTPLAPTTTATPTPSRTASAASTCSAGDTSTTDGVQAILDSTGAMDWLDKMFETMPNHEDDWVNSLWEITFPNEGASPLSGCGDIGSDCDPESMCSAYPSVQSYWVFRSVALLHSKINSVRDQLLWDGWLSGLSIDQIGQDFSSVSPDQTWAKWIAAAFTMAGGIATGIDLSKPLRGMVGFASGALTDVSLTSSPGDQVDTTSVENTLRNIVGAAGNYVADILTNATGNGDADLLPIYSDTDYVYATSRFLADNTILLDENKDNSSFVSAYNTFAGNVEKKLVDVAMKTAWYVLVGEEDVQQSDCDMTGMYWLEAKPGEYRCFYLTRPSDTEDCGDDDPKNCVSDAWEAPYNSNNMMDTGVYSKLTDTYGFDLESYYVSLIDCYLNGNGEVDMTATTDNGQIPRCFYNLYVRSGYWEADDTEMLNLWFDDF